MKIAFVGTGNVASQLVKRIQELNIEILGVIGSTDEKSKAFALKNSLTTISEKSQLAEADLIFLCVQDSRLQEIIPIYADYAPIVTTSGSFDISAFNQFKFPIGVCYPLQTFTPDAVIDFAEIPFFIESSSNQLSNILIQLAKKIGKDGVLMSSEQRVKLHIAAVFINNFTHHINALAREFGESNSIEFSWYEALIKETFRKVLNGAKDIDQTGPARRNDVESIEKHLSLLNSEDKKVYEILTNSILNKFHKK